MKTQNQQVLEHLKRDSLTSMGAIRLFGITRLAARISDLKEQGYTIRTDMISRNKKRFARYTLVGNGTG